MPSFTRASLATGVSAFCCGLLLLFAGGCAEKLPQYSWKNDASAMADLARRGQQVETISGNAAITLEKPNGDRISFESAVVARLPDHFRIRAWKFGHAIFDLTVTPEGVWLQKSERVPKDRIWPATLTPERFASGWAMITGQLLIDATVVSPPGAETVRLQQPLESGLTLTTEVDRATLTVRSYEVHDAEGKRRFALEQRRYRVFGDVVWPTRIIATGPEGTITVSFDETELNLPTAPAAFTAPRRAEKIK